MYRDINDYELLYLICDSDDDFKIMVLKYKPLLNKIIIKYQSFMKKYGYEYDDLYQIGLYALYKTLKTYDSESSLFYTYLGKSLENSIINIIKENDCDKRSLLSKALSYDEEIPNTNLTYLEVFPDLSIKPFDKVIIYQRTYIDIKNSLSFDLACLFELLNEGFNCNEIIQLLSISIKEYDKMVKNIKKQIHYNC